MSRTYYAKVPGGTVAPVYYVYTVARVGDYTGGAVSHHPL